MSFHGGQKKHQALLSREFIHRAIELALKLGVVSLVRRVARIFRYPRCLARLPPLDGAEAIQRQAKTDSNQPCSKTCPLAQPIEPAMRAKHRFLGHVFGVGVITQDSSSDSKSQRRVFRQQRFPVALSGSAGYRFRPFAAQLGGLGLSSAFGQNPLLHGQASSNGSALPVYRQDAADGRWVHFAKTAVMTQRSDEVKNWMLRPGFESARACKNKNPDWEFSPNAIHSP